MRLRHLVGALRSRSHRRVPRSAASFAGSIISSAPLRSRRSCCAALLRPWTRNGCRTRWTNEQDAPQRLGRAKGVREQRTLRTYGGRPNMKIVIIGGTGLIGSKTAPILRQKGHEVVAAAPNTGVNTITGEGLKEVLAGTQVVIDLANSPSFEDKAVLEFFETSGRNLHAAEAAAGVKHHVALSIVGTDRTPENGYFRAKVA